MLFCRGVPVRPKSTSALAWIALVLISLRRGVLYPWASSTITQLQRSGPLSVVLAKGRVLTRPSRRSWHLARLAPPRRPSWRHLREQSVLCEFLSAFRSEVGASTRAGARSGSGASPRRAALRRFLAAALSVLLDPVHPKKPQNATVWSVLPRPMSSARIPPLPLEPGAEPPALYLMGNR